THSAPKTSGHVNHLAGTPIEGLTRAVHKAHEAVGETGRTDQRLQRRSAQASGEAPTSRAHAKSTPTVSAITHTSTASHTQPSTALHTQSAVTRPAPSPSTQHANTASPRAVQLEAELARGKTVLLLFWNPKSVDDQAVRHQLQSAAHALGSKVAVHQASASEVDAFGSLTQRVHVAQTPTILIINPHEQVSTLTGFTDSFVIRQTVAEAQNPTG
ncbi:MAG: hypothetical protein ACRDK2_09120, partial [Solirubrobacteraceae bacterium]